MSQNLSVGVAGMNLAAGNLPKLYIAAQAALFRCDQIDECQEWANKAAAMASYARQARDTAMRDMANRIHARAVRRCGELLGSVNTGEKKMAVASEAGLTRGQYTHAVAVAKIPAERFESIVESPDPPRVYKLAQIGTSQKAEKHVCQLPIPALMKMAQFCDANKPEDFAEGFCQRHQANRVCEWLRRILAIAKDKP